MAWQATVPEAARLEDDKKMLCLNAFYTEHEIYKVDLLRKSRTFNKSVTPKTKPQERSNVLYITTTATVYMEQQTNTEMNGEKQPNASSCCMQADNQDLQIFTMCSGIGGNNRFMVMIETCLVLLSLAVTQMIMKRERRPIGPRGNFMAATV